MIENAISALFFNNLIQNDFHNIMNKKKGCSAKELANTIRILSDLTTIPRDSPKEFAMKVHHNLSSILSDTEGISEICDFLPFVEIFALCIELFTSYSVEVSTIITEDGIFHQIDENNNLFYFSFFKCHLEFAIGNFDQSTTLSWNLEDGPSKLKELGFHESMIMAWETARRLYEIISVKNA